MPPPLLLLHLLERFTDHQGAAADGLLTIVIVGSKIALRVGIERLVVVYLGSIRRGTRRRFRFDAECWTIGAKGDLDTLSDGAASTGRPLTKRPLLLCKSRMIHVPLTSETSACRRLTCVSATSTSQPRSLPM